MTLYRDPLAGSKSQVAQKRGLVELRERELRPLTRAMLPRALSAKLEDLRARALGAGAEEAESLASLAAIDAALDALVAALEEAIALAPKLADCPLDVPDPPKPKQRPPWLIEETRQRALRGRFELQVRQVSPDAYVVRWGDLAYLTRLRIAGAPLVAMTRGNFDVQAIATDFTSTLYTSVPSAAPVVRVKPMKTAGGIAKALRLARDDLTGDEAFDETFLVDAPHGGVLLLTPDVTAAMRALEAWSPRLDVRGGLAQVSWSGTFRDRGEDLLPDAAFAAAMGVRAAIERA